MKLNLYLLILTVFSAISVLAKKTTTKLYSFEPTKNNVKILGRAKYQNGYLWFSLTNVKPTLLMLLLIIMLTVKKLLHTLLFMLMVKSTIKH